MPHCRLSCYTALLSVVDQYWVGPACGGRGVCVCKIRIGACMCTCLWCEVCTLTKRCGYTGVRGTVGYRHNHILPSLESRPIKIRILIDLVSGIHSTLHPYDCGICDR